MSLKVLFWNIEHFGITRGVKPEIVRNVVRVLNKEGADIIAIQEFTVSKWKDINKILPAVLQGLGDEYRFVLTPHNGFEMYLYFYNINKVEALTLQTGGPDYVTSNSISSLHFSRSSDNTSRGNLSYLDNYFPLFDYYDRGSKARAPAMGLFYYVENGDTYGLAVIQWHNDAGNKSFRKGNIRRVAETPIIAQGSMTVNVEGVDEEIDNVIIGGDFNDSLSKHKFPNHYTVNITSNTHLEKFRTSNDSTFKSIDDILDLRLDNIVHSFNSDELVLVQCEVVKVPENIMKDKKTTTKSDLRKSDLLAQINREGVYKKRMMNKIKTGKKFSGITKRRVSTILDSNRVARMRTTTFEEKIKESKIPLSDQEIITRLGVQFLMNEVGKPSRWSVRYNNMNGLLWNDVLALYREWLSDHLPVTIELKPK